MSRVFYDDDAGKKDHLQNSFDSSDSEAATNLAAAIISLKAKHDRNPAVISQYPVDTPVAVARAPIRAAVQSTFPVTRRPAVAINLAGPTKKKEEIEIDDSDDEEVDDGHDSDEDSGVGSSGDASEGRMLELSVYWMMDNEIEKQILVVMNVHQGHTQDVHISDIIIDVQKRMKFKFYDDAIYKAVQGLMVDSRIVPTTEDCYRIAQHTGESDSDSDSECEE